jgi:hypothetical protein
MDPIVQGYEIKLNTLALVDGEESPVPLTLGGRFGESVEFSIVVSVAGRLSSTYVVSVILHGQLPIPSNHSYFLLLLLLGLNSLAVIPKFSP